MIKEINKEDIMPFQSLQSKIGLIFDSFRNNNISSDDYHVLLYLISAYKDNLFSIELVNDNSQTKERLIEQLRNSNNDLKSQYNKIFQIFEPTIQRLSENTIKHFFTVFGYLNKQFLIENFADIFEVLLFRITQTQGRYAGEIIRPVELTRFMCELVELNKSAKIFNPFAGLASFGIYLDKGQEFSGQEQNQKTWALGALRLMANSRPVNLKYVCDDSILNWPAQNEKFDMIISSPPFGVRIRNQIGEIKPNFRTIEHFLIEKGVQSLTQNGKLVALLPQGFLFRGMQDERLRKHLIEEDLIDTIISLPGGLLSNTEMSLIILLLNKNKKLPGKVKFVDAKSFVIVKGSREKILNDNSLISTVKSYKEYEDVVKIVSNEQIAENNYNLSVERYFKKQIEGVKLGEVLELVRVQRGNFPIKGKLIRIRDLKDDKVDCNLDYSSLEETVLSRRDIQLIAESCLLLAMRWRSLKPTLFEFKGNTIFKSQDILSFKINESIVDKAYLINELHSDYVQEQLESFRLGNSIIPFLRRHDLMEVVIKLPSLKEQRAKMQGIYELSDKIKMLNAERDALTHGVGVKLYESVSTIKHSLGKPLLNIGSSLRNIGNALSRFTSDWELIKLNERYDITIKDSFDSIYNNLELINSILRNNETVLDVSNYELKELEFLSFIKGYVNRIKSSEKSNVSTNLDIHRDIKIELKNKVSIMANAELLEIALNAIVENANLHAFTNDTEKYKIEFRISIYIAPNFKKTPDDKIGRFDSYIKVELANNGKTFPQNYSLEKLIRKNSFAGETGNTGQGGFDLNEIIKYHNNGISTLELITEDLSTEFTTTYSFLIPINR